MGHQALYSAGASSKHNVDQMSYPPQPGSPTLTNPDMILPDYDRADSPEDRSPSPTLMWTAQPSATLRNQMLPPESFVAGPMTPTTPIIYGNGTMLSDIGEVTEVESNADGPTARRTSSRYSNQSFEDVTVRSSPTMGHPTMQQNLSQKAPRERRSSIESTSTIRSRGHVPFADFDDAVSVDDTNFQGDDEESMASSYVDDNPVQGHVAVQQPIVQGVAEETYATSTLSQRAEQILANAKRRLTTMEGNLTRARSSLAYSEGSTPSPPLIRPRTALHESSTSPALLQHVRNKSDDGLHAALPPTSFPQRAASALGAAGGYRKPSGKSRGDISGGNLFRGNHLVSNYPLDTALETLSEDDDGSMVDSKRDSGPYTNSLTPTFGNFMEKNMTRSASAAQMREIQDQMQGLKGKISTLKEQARADSLKRRSLQSLRTPSPFTHSRWEHGFGSQGDDESNPASPPLLSPDEDQQKTPTTATPHEFPVTLVQEEDAAQRHVANAHVSPEEDRLPTPPTEKPHDVAFGHDHPQEDPVQDLEDSRSTSPNKTTVSTEEDDQSDPEKAVHPEVDEDQLSGQPEAQEEEVSDYESDAGESQYHESFQHPVSHEDREDAFDYEHFFLHSAMGNLRHTRRDSMSSVSSTDSIETARGADRRASIDTTISTESFRTADEGRASRSSAVEQASSDQPNHDAAARSHRQQHSAYSGFRFRPDETSQEQVSRPRTNSVIHRPVGSSTAVSLHRPSISSFESTGTNRSFPLVNKAKLNAGVLTPGDSPEQGSKHQALGSTGSATRAASSLDSGLPSAVHELSKEDQLLVQSLIAGLGQCVLKLSEGSRASTEGRLNLRRLEAARRILEGLDDV